MWYSVGWSRIIGPDWLYMVFRYIYLTGMLGCVAMVVVYAITWITHARARSTQRDWRQPAIAIMQSFCLLLAIVFAIILADLWQMTGRKSPRALSIPRIDQRGSSLSNWLGLAVHTYVPLAHPPICQFGDGRHVDDCIIVWGFVGCE